MLRFEGIDHLVLRVRDVERMLAFYVDALGCTLERTQEDIGLYQLRAGDGLIDLMTGPSAPAAARNLDHFCLRLAEFDEPDIRRRLAGKGIVCGETASRYGARGQGPSIYIEDPEGNVVELKAPGKSSSQARPARRAKGTSSVAGGSVIPRSSG